MDLSDITSEPAAQADRILATLRDFTQLAREHGLMPPAVDAENRRRLEAIASGEVASAEATALLTDILPAIADELARIAREVAKQRGVAPSRQRTVH
jgi:hypothetical protein